MKINLVKLTFWTAIFSHQVMGMSLTKVWVINSYTAIQLIQLGLSRKMKHWRVKGILNALNQGSSNHQLTLSGCKECSFS